MKKKRSLRIWALITALVMTAPVLGCLSELKTFAEDELNYIVIAPQDDINRDEDLEPFVMPEYMPMFSFPEEMRGVYITPTVDYAKPDENGLLPDEEIIIEQVEKMLENAELHRLNSVIVNTDYNGEELYSKDVNQTVETAVVEYVINAAKERGFFCISEFQH